MSGDIIFFVFLSLLFIVLAYEFRKLIKFPVAPLLLGLGILMRTVLVYVFESSMTITDHIDPHLILLGIIPALVYEASLDTEWFTFKNELGQILPLATTVAVGSAILNALVIEQIIGFEWKECLILGVLLSATDHVAVAAQLKDIFADTRLETLISGETFLNEAAVIVLFYVVLDESDLNWPSYFCRLTLGGILFGFVVSLMVGAFLQRILNDDIQETTLTLAATYLIYYFADTEPLYVSGAIAVTTWGLYMSAYGKTCISPAVEGAVHSFWKTTGRNVEALLFIIAGMLLGMYLLEKLQLEQLLVSVVIFLVVYVVRAFVVMIHYPLLNYFGYGLELSEALVVILSGTKGTISIALALVAAHHESIDPEIRHDVLFYSTTVAALSMTFGGFVVKIAVRKLGLESLNEIQEKMLVGVSESIVQRTDEKAEKLMKDKDYAMANWEHVAENVGPQRLIRQIMKKTGLGKELIKSDVGPDELLDLFKKNTGELNKDQLLRETRRRYLSSLRGVYWHEFENGRCYGDTALILMRSANTCIDKDDKPINDWKYVEKDIFSNLQIKVLFQMSKIPLLGGYAIQKVHERISMSYDACTTFIRAHQEAIELVENVQIDFDSDTFAIIQNEANEQVKNCKGFLKMTISGRFPELIESVQTNMVCHALLKFQAKTIDKIYRQGIIEELEYEYMKTALDANRNILSFDKSISMPSIKSIVKKRFQRLDEDTLNYVVSNIKEELYENEAILFKEGEECQGAYLILAGSIQEWSDWIDQELIVGNITGVLHLLPDVDQNLTSAHAIGIVRTLFLPKSLLEIESILEDIYEEAAEEILLYNKEPLGLENTKRGHIYDIVRHSKVKSVKKGDEVSVRSGCFVLKGRLGNIRAYGYAYPGVHVANRRCIILELPELMSGYIQKSENLNTSVKAFYHRRSQKPANFGGSKIFSSVVFPKRFSGVVPDN